MKYSKSELPSGWELKKEIRSYEKTKGDLVVRIHEGIFGHYLVQAFDKNSPNSIYFTKDTFIPKEAFDTAEYVFKNNEKKVG